MDRRARALPGEYMTKARDVDRTFCGTAADQVGPVERRLRNFDPVRGLVFGTWGEGSSDVHKLIGILAEFGAGPHWRSMMATSCRA